MSAFLFSIEINAAAAAAVVYVACTTPMPVVKSHRVAENSENSSRDVGERHLYLPIFIRLHVTNRLIAPLVFLARYNCEIETRDVEMPTHEW